MVQVARSMSVVWGSEVRCEEVGMEEALQELVRAGVMEEEAALGLSNFLRCIGT